MPHLGGEPARPVQELTVDEDPRAHSRAEGKQDKVADALARAAAVFTVGGDIGVVVDPEGDLDKASDGRPQVEPVEVGIIRRLVDLLFLEAEGPRDAETEGLDSPPLFFLQLFPELAEELQEPGHRRRGRRLALEDHVEALVEKSILELSPSEVEPGIQGHLYLLLAAAAHI